MPSNAKSRYGRLVVERQAIQRSLANNVGDLAHLEGPCAKLEGMLQEIEQLRTEQSLLQARKQETTRRIQELLEQTGKLVTFIKTGIKEHYGHDNEKLVEFGLQPFRRRRRETRGETQGEPQTETAGET